MLDPACLYFSVSTSGECFNGEFCGESEKQDSEALPDDQTNPGGIYQVGACVRACLHARERETRAKDEGGETRRERNQRREKKMKKLALLAG